MILKDRDHGKDPFQAQDPRNRCDDCGAPCEVEKSGRKPPLCDECAAARFNDEAAQAKLDAGWDR